MAIKFLSGSATQGSADAFVSTSLATGTGGLNVGLLVRAIEVFLDSAVETDCDISAQLTRRSTTAIVRNNDRRLLWDYQERRLLTTSGLIRVVLPQYQSYSKDFGLVIAEDPIYMVVDSTSTSVANSAYFRIYYETIRLTDSEKNALLAESANA